MTPQLEQETARLTRSWMRHDGEMLRDYLVADVEDPRLNVQSILSRHFLLRALTGDRFLELMEAECRFAGVMNWLSRWQRGIIDPGEPACLIRALETGADNVEGVEIPRFVTRVFASLPSIADGFVVPEYVSRFLEPQETGSGGPLPASPGRDVFCDLWREALASLTPAPPGGAKLKVLEPACGSANDYRALAACGIAAHLDYTGFDLCPRNAENARALFPSIRFEVGNAFEIHAPDQTYEICFVHDLFEHLSPDGLQTAVAEIARVTRGGICAGFFNMDETPEHEIQPVDDYHWNRLSMERTRELFRAAGFEGQVLHIGTLLNEQFGCDQTHNPNAYTFYLFRETA